MRFETPQTTPSFLSRRFQLRMLSFVGLISVILLALGVLRSPSTVRQENQVGVPAGEQSTLKHESRRDRPALNSGSFVASVNAENDGPRGQWIEANPRERTRDAKAGQDRELFQRRGQERVRDPGLFPRRITAPTDFNDQPADGNPGSQDDQFLDDDRNESPPSSTNRPRNSHNAAPRSDNDFDSISESTTAEPRASDEERMMADPVADPRWTNEGFDQPVSRNRQPLPGGIYRPGGNTLPGSNSLPGSNTLPDDNSFPDSDSVPESVDDYPQGGRNRDIDSIPATDPMNRRNRNDPPRRDFDRGDLSGDGSDFSNPTFDRRLTGDRGDSSPSNSEPFLDDVASVRIDKQYLDLVKDNTVGIRRDEAEVFYWLLDHARRVASSALERSGLTEVQYINLMTEPDRFRGEPITIEGDLWSLYEFDAGRNDYGIGRMYEGWVFTGDSGNHPFRIVFTSLPRGIVPGDNIRKPIRLTGYFFKREGYQSQGGIHFAPVLLARKIHINPLPNGLSFPTGFTPHIVGVIMAMGLALLVTIIGFSISDERSSQDQMQRLRRYPQLSFANLPVPDFTSVEEALRQLAEREHNSAIRGAYGPLLSRQTLREHALQSYPQQTIGDQLTGHHRPSDVVHNWATRQQQLQADINALRSPPAQKTNGTLYDDDDLSSDRLAPARNILPKVSKPIHQAADTDSLSFSAPISVPPVVSPPPVPRQEPSITLPVVMNPHPVVSQLHSVVTTTPSNIDYRASKLSEWEDEVSKMQNRSNGLRASNLMGFSRESVADQIEHDRLAREQEVQDRIHHPQPNSQQTFEEQVQQEWAEHERHRHEPHSITHDQTQFDLNDEDLGLDDDDSPLVDDHHSRVQDQSDPGDASNKSAWGRNRKRRRNWRDGNVS